MMVFRRYGNFQGLLMYAIIESNVSCFMNRPRVFQQLDAYSKNSYDRYIEWHVVDGKWHCLL